MKIAQFDLFRNTDAPLVGYKGNPFSWPGKCLTAQAVIFHAAAMDTLNISQAYWRLCWLPNINNGAQTAVRLVSADSGPTNIQQVAAFFGSNNISNPLNDVANITQALHDLIASHKSTGAEVARMFSMIHQTAGDGVNAPLIYSSSLEIIFGD